MPQTTRVTQAPEAGDFLKNLKVAAEGKNIALDSAVDQANGIATDLSSGCAVPPEFQAVLDEAGDEKGRYMAALLDSANAYEREHGRPMPDDVAAHTMHTMYSATSEGAALDSATNAHHDQYALQPARAIVSVIANAITAIPNAAYLPADIASNEATLVIASNMAGDTTGAYAQGQSLDGINMGDPYFTSSRTTTLDNDGKGKITIIQSAPDVCEPTGEIPALLRGRTRIYVGGVPSAFEADSRNTTTDQVAINGVYVSTDSNGVKKEHVLSGSIKHSTGEVAMAATPALPGNIKMVAEAFIDFERSPELAPSVLIGATAFKIYAQPLRGFVTVTPEARSQFNSEVKLDPLAQSLGTAATQVGMERHYSAIQKGLRIGQALAAPLTFDFAWSTQGLQKSRAQIWQDFGSIIAAESLAMITRTFGFGISTIYGGKNFVTQVSSLPSEIFVSSGISPRASIYRVGRLFGMYDVYYTPKHIVETGGSTQILCVGSSSDVARNPIVVGDACALNFKPMGVGKDQKEGSVFNARNFTDVNPFSPSAQGFAVINISNLT